MATLSKIAARVWRELGFSIDLKVTGAGSTTTIVSTESPYTSDDAQIGGTAIVTYDAGGAGAAPEGEWTKITDYVATTTTFTTDALTVATSAGDRVLIAGTKIKLPQMIQAVNDALTNLGTISLVDTSLTTVSGQLEYALPVALKIKSLTDILIQGDSSTPYQSIKGMFRDFPAAPASTGILEVREGLTAGKTLKIVYEGVHPTLTAYNSVVSETIQEELAVSAAIDKALTWYVSKKGNSVLGTFVVQRWNDAKNTLQAQRAEKPIYKAKPAAKWFIA